MCIGVRTRTTTSILSYTWTAIKYVYRACISNTPLKLNSLDLDYELRHDNSALTNPDLTDDDNGLVSKSARFVLVDS